MTLDELRTLDFRDMPNWPLQGQLAALFLMIVMVLAAAYFLVFSSIQEEIARSALSTNQCCIIFLSARHSWPAIPASTDRPVRSSCR